MGKMGKNNISKFNQIDNTILLEYIINNFLNDNEEVNSFDRDQFTLNDNQVNVINWDIKISNNDTGLMYVDNISKYTNNSYNRICLPIDKEGINYFEPNNKDNLITYYKEITKGEDIIIKEYYSNNTISYDTVRLHILSGYSFEDVYGIYLKIFFNNNDKDIVTLSSWIYKNTDLEYHFEKPIIINNKIFDKYIELKIPSIQFLKSQNLGNDKLAELIRDFNIEGENNTYLPNINITFSIIKNEDIEEIYVEDILSKKKLGNKFHLENKLEFQIPYNSLTDNFNVQMRESSNGNWIDFYTTWYDEPLNSSIVSMFNTKYQLYETQKSIYKDNIYDIDEDKNQWFVIHEITSSFYNKDGKKIIPDETYSLTQEFNFDVNEKKVFKYKPIILNDIDSVNLSYITFTYVARLINRLDGVQIVRYGSITSDKKEKYLNNYYKLNTNNMINYSLYNKIVKNEQNLINTSNLISKNKFIKVFYNTKDIYIDDKNSSNFLNEELTLIKNTSTYKLTLKRKNENGDDVFFNMNDMSSYIICFPDNDGKSIEINPTYSSNMNLTLGELEFTISKNTIDKLLKSDYNFFDIMVINANGSRSTIYEGKYKFKQ